MSTAPSIASVTVDCRDAQSLAQFWAKLLDRAVAADASPEYASVDGAPPLTFIAVPEEKQAKNRMHLDLSVDDLDAAAQRAVDLGASLLRAFDEGGYRWISFTDPEGNEFDLVLSS
jgi:predicted enzyme related to lactoylglutathione lyase